MSRHHERHSKPLPNPEHELRKHRDGLGETIRDIYDHRLETRGVGKAGITASDVPVTRDGKPARIADGIPAMHAGEYGRHSFAATAQKLVKRPEFTKTPDQKMYMDLLATLPSMIDSKEYLRDEEEDYSHSHFETTSEHYNAKMHMVQFNEVLHSIIDTRPQMQATTVIGLVKSIALRYGYERDEVNAAAEETSSALYGAKHELAFESALHRLPPGYEVIDTDAIDDKHGADLLVRCPNGVIVSIDVKSSALSAQRREQKNEAYHRRRGTQVPRNEIIMYSGFTSEDFRSDYPWRPSEEAIERVLPNIEARLRKAAGMSNLSVAEVTR